MNNYITYIVVYLLLSAVHVHDLFAQENNQVLHGRVIDVNDDEPVENATVRVQGADLQSVTDRQGYFRLALGQLAETGLVVSKVGYVSDTLSVREYKGGGLVVRLSPALHTVEEVTVSTGYQRIPKERATGSFEHVGNKLFNRQIGTDVISRLDGIMPSLLFDKRGGGERNILNRGVAALGGSSTTGPLIVVDNFPFEGDINSINPHDVESVTLLKDAAASSIWGARAGNGVLVITTKQGSYDVPWRLAVNANTTLAEKPDLYYIPRMSTSDYIDIEQFLYQQGAFNSVLNNTTTRPAVSPVVELMHRHADPLGDLTDEELTSLLDRFRQMDVRSDLSEYFYRTGVNQQYSVSLTGGGRRHNSLVSIGYDRNSSTAVGDGFTRANINFQNMIRPLSRLEIHLGIRYSMMQDASNNAGHPQMMSGRPIYPYADLVDDDGNALIVDKDYRSSYLDVVESRGDMLDWRYRPYEELFLADNTSKTDNMLFNLRARYDFLHGLSGEVYYQYEYQPISTRQHHSQQTYYARNVINRFTQIDGHDIIRPVPLGGILDRTHSDLISHAGRGQLNYNNSWGKHATSVIVGTELRHRKNTGSTDRLFGYNEDLLISHPVNYVDRLPIYDNLGAASVIPYLNRDYARLQRFVSFYTNGSYTYDSKYIVSLSMRRDASNLFGVETNNKWKPLWSIGGAWNVHDENFVSKDWLPLLKLRATYGYAGNVRSDQPAVTTLTYRGLTQTARLPFAVLMNGPNPSLRWEKVGTVNVGIDFALRDNRLSGSIEYYRKTSTDLITDIDSDPTTGFNFLVMNSATVQNTGLDVSLNGLLTAGSVEFRPSFLLSVNKNEVLKYMREANRMAQWVGNGTAILPNVGQPVYSVVSYRSAGLDPENGDPIGYLNGEPSKDYALIDQEATADDLVFHGAALPEYFGAFRNSIAWKGLTASFNITYRAGYFFRRESIDYTTLLRANTTLGHADFYDRWQQPGDELYTDVPSMVYPVNSRRNAFYRESDVTVEKGDHIRLQDISISYLFSSRHRLLAFRDIRGTFYARNLGILWRSNDRDIDPDFRNLPHPRTYALGLTANF